MLLSMTDVLVNMPYSVVVDIMHQAHEGVTKRLLQVMSKIRY